MPSTITSNVPAGKTSLLRILVVDDHPLYRKGVTLTLECEPDMQVCGEAGGMSQALTMYRDKAAHVVMTDLCLKDGSGLELIPELLSIDEDARILVCSMHDETLFAERVLRAGAKGYINKAYAVDDLVTAVRRVSAGHVHVSQQMADSLLTGRTSWNRVRPRSPVATLSDRELEVFEQIGHGLTTRQIADKLDLSPKTIETYRMNIKRKLDVSTAAKLAQHAVQWVLENS